MSKQNSQFLREKFLSDLAVLINTDSGTEDIDGCRKIAAFLADQLKDTDCHTRILSCGQEKRPLLLACHGSRRPYDFLLLGHMDTVFPPGAAKERPFRIKEDQAFGPGAVDMKAGALLMLYIFRHLVSTCPDISICLAINSDEEHGSPSTAPYLLRLAQKSRRAFVFEGGRKKGQFVNQRKGCIKYQIQIHGIASHAGTAPAQGASAIVEGARWVMELDRQKRYDRGTSVNIGQIEGGTALNVVPDFCCLKVEIRYTDRGERQRLEKVIEKLQKKPAVSGTHAEIDLLADTPPLFPDKETQALMAQMKAYGMKSGFPVDFVSAGGLSDANRIAATSIPVIDGCGPGGGFPHSEKEFLTISTVESRFRFMTGLMEAIYRSSV